MSDWRSQAACLGEDPELFYRIGNRAKDKADDIAQAKAVCARCQVLAECAVTADGHGTWAGTTEDERHNLKRREQRSVRKVAKGITSGPEYAKQGHIAGVPGLRRAS
jgi:WhiB family redox-sensing transcriptional regulator